MSLFAKVFSTRTLVPIACVLGGVFFMKGLGAYYDFKWATALAAQLGNSPGWLSVIKIATRARTKRLPPVVPVFVSHFTNSDAPGEINLICPSDNLNRPYKF